MPKASTNALAIGGSSTTGAAGVEADLKTFAALGVHAAVVVTAVASQNTKGVQNVFYLPADVVSQQLDSVFSDMKIRAVKIGMLGNNDITRVVLDALEKRKCGSIVLDTVMTAQSDGSWLVSKDSLKEMKKLVRRSTVVSPNAFEAEKLTGIGVRNIDDASRAAVALKAYGAEAVVIKGVKQGGRINDIILHKDLRIFSKEMIRTGTHGGGCCFSSAIAAALAKGLGIDDAVEVAEKFTSSAIRNSVKLGGGVEAVEPLATLRRKAWKWAVAEDVKSALRELESCRGASSLIPEVGTNIVCAVPEAGGIGDVAGVVGRIRNAMGQPRSIGEVSFGASSHLARAVLKMMEFDSSKRAAVNVRLTEENLQKCRKMGLVISNYDRAKEPKGIREKEGATIPWGIEYAVRRSRRIPDAVYHQGGVGREPSLVIFGKDAKNVVRLVLKLVSPKA